MKIGSSNLRLYKDNMDLINRFVKSAYYNELGLQTVNKENVAAGLEQMVSPKRLTIQQKVMIAAAKWFESTNIQNKQVPSKISSESKVVLFEEYLAKFGKDLKEFEKQAARLLKKNANKERSKTKMTAPFVHEKLPFDKSV